MVAYYGSADIPGKNKAQPYPGPTFQEELLCSGTVGYAGQPVGIVVAESAGTARYPNHCIYRLTHLLGKNVPLTWILDVPPSCLGSRQLH